MADIRIRKRKRLRAKEVKALAEQIEAAAVAMGKAGITLSYHNHDIEFKRVEGELVLDLIYGNAPHLLAEIDTYWVQSGGQNPVKWIERFSGREPLLHLKEYGVLSQGVHTMFAVGHGNLDWRGIIAAGEAAGVEYFIVEQDNCNGADPFEELRRSYDYLTANFCD